MIPDGPLHVESLTQRERQMAQAVSRGLRNRQIARGIRHQRRNSEEASGHHLRQARDQRARRSSPFTSCKVAFKVTCAQRRRITPAEVGREIQR